MVVASVEGHALRFFRDHHSLLVSLAVAQMELVKSESDTEKSESEKERNEERLQRIANAAKIILENIGEDSTRAGLLDTPMRMAKAMAFFTQGYNMTLEQVIGRGVFDEDEKCDGMVVMRDIDVWSLCEHHMVPFYGKAHIAYLPKGRLLGLSKLARICELYSRRLQVQERLTQQVAEAVHLSTLGNGVGVVIECTHMCVNMRGVQKNGALTSTSYMIGEFRDNAKTREEFLALVLRK